jgi:hypothetical protein
MMPSENAPVSIAMRDFDQDLAHLDVPSREGNPFATCWTRPGALAFRFPEELNAEALIAQFASQNWRGVIVGPHGSGKSTLLATLRPLLSAAGQHVSTIVVRTRQRRLPRNFLRTALAPANPLIIVDGFEQLSRLSRAWLCWQCRQKGAGLLITSHAETCLPTLIRLQPDVELTAALVADLTRDRNSHVTSADIAASHARHGSNIRELLFDLYDRHEASRRAQRTDATIVA